MKKKLLHYGWKDPLYIILILTGYVVLTILFTYPLITNFSTAIPGHPNGDASTFLWNLWWTKYALLDLKTNPFYTDYIFYPKGVGLTFHSFAFLNGLISIPLQVLFGLVVAHNIITISSFVFSAFGAYLLLNYTTSDRLSSFIGGILFAFCPYKFGHLLGHYGLVSTQWIPLYILFLIRMTKEERSKILNGILAGLSLLFTALTEQYYLIFLGIFTILYLGYVFFTDKKTIMNRAFFKSSMGLSAIFIIGFLPILLFALMDVLRGDYGKVPGAAGGGRYVADLLGLFTPSVLHPILGKYAWMVSKHFKGNVSEWTVFLGYTVVFFTLFAIRKFYSKDSQVRFWTLSFIVFLIFSLGPFPRILGIRLPIPLPFLLVRYIPVLNNLRVPSRFNILVMLSCAVLFAFSLRFVFCKLKKTWIKSLAAIMVIGSISFEYLAIPFPMFNTERPSIYERIGGDKEEGTILEIPLGWGDGFKRLGVMEGDFMYYQTIHQKRIFGGYIGRFPDNRIVYYRNLPIVKDIITLEEQNGTQPPSVTEKESAKAFVTSFKVRYITVRQPFFNSPVHKYILEVFPVDRIYEDRNMIVYRTNVVSR